jgi:hypothetical protein
MERCGTPALELLVERAREAAVERAVAVTLGVLHRDLEHQRARDCARQLPQGLWLRAELAIAGVAARPEHRRQGLLTKSLAVFLGHTHRALLANAPAAGVRQWKGSIRRSIGNFFRSND